MTDEALEVALQRLLEQRTQIDQAISALQQLLGGGQSSGQATHQSATSQTSPRPMSASPRGGEVVVYPGEFFNLSITKAAERVLKRAGRPLKTAEIVSALRRAEFPMKAQSPESNLYTSLSRSKDFVKVLPNTWALAEWHPDIVPADSKGTRKGGRRKARRQKREKTGAQAADSASASRSKSVISRVVETVKDTASQAAIHAPMKAVS